MATSDTLTTRQAGFIDDMDCLPVTGQPEGPLWTCEVKLDGDCIEAVKGTRDVTLYSRRESMLNEFPHFAKH